MKKKITKQSLEIRTAINKLYKAVEVQFNGFFYIYLRYVIIY